MATGANRCPGCGAERSADAPEGLCPACLMRQAREGDTLVPADVASTIDPSPAGPGHAPVPAPDDVEATRPKTDGPAPTPDDATRDWTPNPGDPTLSGDGHRGHQ